MKFNVMKSIQRLVPILCVLLIFTVFSACEKKEPDFEPEEKKEEKKPEIKLRFFVNSELKEELFTDLWLGTVPYDKASYSVQQKNSQWFLKESDANNCNYILYYTITDQDRSDGLKIKFKGSKYVNLYLVEFDLEHTIPVKDFKPGCYSVEVYSVGTQYAIRVWEVE